MIFTAVFVFPDDSEAGRLTETQQQFARWRQACRRPGRIPTELWMLAAEAAAEQGVEQTARALQLSPERLEQWCQQLGLNCESTKNQGMQFLELSPMPWTATGECQVEVENPSGRNLRISLAGSDDTDCVGAAWTSRRPSRRVFREPVIRSNWFLSLFYGLDVSSGKKTGCVVRQYLQFHVQHGFGDKNPHERNLAEI